jgi:tetrapyrrole methylase family protein / MazG family protein
MCRFPHVDPTLPTPDDSTAAASFDLRPLAGKQDGLAFQSLVGLMQRLLAPGGCPWDREQTLQTLVPYLVEETYEVVDALAEGSVEDHREELGDLLLQVVFQSELRFSEGHFGIDDVARGIVTKLIRRHPHVFGDVQVSGADEVLSNWAKVKAVEKAERGKHGALHGIPRSAPALLRATRAGEKAAAVGFDFATADDARDKVDEELRELDAARVAGDVAHLESELGDALFALVNLGRKLDLDPESALRQATDRFARRFEHLEAALAASGRAVADASPDEQDRLWQEAKRATAASAAEPTTRERSR